MNNTVSNKKTVLALSLAVLVSGLSSNISANYCCTTPVATAAMSFTGLTLWDLYNNGKNNFSAAKLGKNAAAAAALAFFVRYFTKESVTEDKYTEKGDVKKLADVKKIASKEYWKNFLTVIDEKIIGQRPKDGKIKVEQKGDKLVLGGEVSARKPGKGLLGKTEELAKPFSDAAASAGALILALFGADKIQALRNYYANKFGFTTITNAVDGEATVSTSRRQNIDVTVHIDRAGNVTSATGTATN